ncbi:MAG TPA: polysaccharide biosynthesis/export family protein [Xanthobacteraceae bacterium]|nr:polysaccharide biosynthesis/export family protein [Xanthobacteraceae bacterium]
MRSAPGQTPVFASSFAGQGYAGYQGQPGYDPYAYQAAQPMVAAAAPMVAGGGTYMPPLTPAPAYAAPVAAAPAYAAPPAPAYVQAAPAYAAPVSAGSYEEPYTLDAGDRIRVVVFGQEGLNASYIVDPSGLITLPLCGPIQARGLTKDQLAAAITHSLKQGYIREPLVAVDIESYRPFFILGEVTAPGQYPFVANMTVETAVAIAGGYTPRADRKNIRVTRAIAGQMHRATLPALATLRPGDTIEVGERWF